LVSIDLSVLPQNNHSLLSYSDNTHALVMIAMALLIILDSDMPEADTPEESGLALYLNSTQLHEHNSGWISISEPVQQGAAASSPLWPSVNIYMASNFSSGRLDAETFDLMIHIEYKQGGKKKSIRFKLVLKSNMLGLYTLVKNKNWFRKDDDDDDSVVSEAALSGAWGYLFGCCERGRTNSDESSHRVLSENSPLIQRALTSWSSVNSVLKNGSKLRLRANSAARGVGGLWMVSSMRTLLP
jgi:hypothetical protein